MSAEISDSCCALEALLAGRMEKNCGMSFAEPDIEFGFRTAKRLYNIPGKIIYRDGYKDVDCYLDMYVNFWCSDGLGSNTFSMVLDRQEIEAFCIYLKTVIGELSEASSVVHELIKKECCFLNNLIASRCRGGIGSFWFACPSTE